MGGNRPYGKDLKNLGPPLYNGEILDSEVTSIIIDNEASIFMAKSSKETTWKRYVLIHCHYISRGTALKEQIFSWTGTKSQVTDMLWPHIFEMTSGKSRTFWSVIDKNGDIYCWTKKRHVWVKTSRKSHT